MSIETIRQQDAGLWIVLRRCRYTKKGVLKQPLQMPIAPLDEFGWDVNYSWTDYDTISQGQFSTAGGRQLRTLNLSTMALDWIAPWSITQVRETPADDPLRKKLETLQQALANTTDPTLRAHIQERIRRLLLAGDQGKGDTNLTDEAFWGDPTEIGPWGIARQLDRLVTQGTPMRLVVRDPSRERAEVNMLVTLRTATLRERAGEPDARYFDLSFTEYRVSKINRNQYGQRHELPAQVVITAKGVAIETRRGDKRLKKNQRHKIGSEKSPATLRKLAKHYYGTPKEWKRIAKRNNIAKSISGDDSLEKLYNRRKRRNDPVRLNIPARAGDTNSGGARP